MISRRSRIKQRGADDDGAPAWLLTYGDMTTLLLAFFILLFTSATIDGYELRLILAAFPGLGTETGGNTLQEGRLAELGNTILSLPSTNQGRYLDRALQNATSIFQPEVRNRVLRISEDKRGIVISLAADAFFDSASADLNIEETRNTFIKLASILNSGDLQERKFRIEGHSDSIPPSPTGQWPTNWDLSAARALTVFRFLQDYGVNEQQLQVMALADTVPLFSNDTVEGRAYNRRVDIVILTDGHL